MASSPSGDKPPGPTKNDPSRSSNYTYTTTTTDAPPIPPPDYRTVPIEEWSKRRMPPLKGAILDKDFLPTEAEKRAAIETMRNSSNARNDSSTPSPSPTSQSPQSPPPAPPNLYRSSGTSTILGRAAPAPDGKVHNLLAPAPGTRHTSAGTKSSDLDGSSSSSNSGDAGLREVMLGIRPQDFVDMWRQPCAREAGLTGLGAAFAVSGVGWVTGRAAARMVVGWGMPALLVGFVGAFAFCDYRRLREKRTIRMIKETWNEKLQTKAADFQKYKEQRKEQLRGEKEKESIDINSKKGWWSLWSNTTHKTDKGITNREG